MAAEGRAQNTQIVVFAVDPRFQTFRENTSTVLVAPTWARVRLRHSITPGTTLVIFNVENGRQAEFLVDSNPAPGEVSLVQMDPEVDVWGSSEPKFTLPVQRPVAGRPVRETQLRQELEAALRVEAEARAAVDRARQKGEEAATAKAAEAARRAQVEAAAQRAAEEARLVEGQLAAEVRTVEAAQCEAIRIALRAVESLKSEVAEMALRAELARDRAEALTRETREACAQAAAAGNDLEMLRAAKSEADQKLEEARRELQAAHEAWSGVGAGLGSAGVARSQREAAERALEAALQARLQAEKALAEGARRPASPAIAEFPVPVEPPVREVTAAPFKPPVHEGAAVPLEPPARQVPPLPEAARYVTGPVSWDDRRSSAGSKSRRGRAFAAPPRSRWCSR